MHTPYGPVQFRCGWYGRERNAHLLLWRLQWDEFNATVITFALHSFGIHLLTCSGFNCHLLDPWHSLPVTSKTHSRLSRTSAPAVLFLLPIRVIKVPTWHYCVGPATRIFVYCGGILGVPIKERILRVDCMRLVGTGRAHQPRELHWTRVRRLRWLVLRAALNPPPPLVYSEQ